jgi:inorganic pyrophosphatase
MTNPKDFLGKKVYVLVDRPLDSPHPEHHFKYPVNYGYVPDTKMADGEALDAYVLGIDEPIESLLGECVAVIHRTDDDDDKLIIVPEGKTFTDPEIEKLVEFQEKWFKHVLIR